MVNLLRPCSLARLTAAPTKSLLDKFTLRALSAFFDSLLNFCTVLENLFVIATYNKEFYPRNSTRTRQDVDLGLGRRARVERGFGCLPWKNEQLVEHTLNACNALQSKVILMQLSILYLPRINYETRQRSPLTSGQTSRPRLFIIGEIRSEL